MTHRTPELLVPGTIPPLYQSFIQDVYDRLKVCRSIQEAKQIKFPGKKPGSLYVCAERDQIIFFERRNEIFASIKFKA